MSAQMKGEFAELSLSKDEKSATDIVAGVMYGRDGKPDYYLVLLAGRARRGWNLGVEFATSIGGSLPTAREMHLLIANVPDQFKIGNADFYWTSECNEEFPDHALSFAMKSGYQTFCKMSEVLNVCAVKRVEIK